MPKVLKDWKTQIYRVELPFGAVLSAVDSNTDIKKQLLSLGCQLSGLVTESSFARTLLITDYRFLEKQHEMWPSCGKALYFFKEVFREVWVSISFLSVLFEFYRFCIFVTHKPTMKYWQQ